MKLFEKQDKTLRKMQKSTELSVLKKRKLTLNEEEHVHAMLKLLININYRDIFAYIPLLQYI